MENAEREGFPENTAPSLKAGEKIAGHDLEKELERIRELEEGLGKPILGSVPFSNYL